MATHRRRKKIEKHIDSSKRIVQSCLPLDEKGPRYEALIEGIFEK